jgi:lysyl endopeptidase
MKQIKYILLLHFSLLCYVTLAQVKTNFNNEKLIINKGWFDKSSHTEIDFEIPSKNINDLLEKEKQELAAAPGTKPFRLAVAVKVDLDIAKLMEWTTDKEFVFGKYNIKLNGALSSSLNFDKFYLPTGSEMYVYNENGNMITGPVTVNENNANKIWGSWVYQGALLTIEIKTPIVSKEELMLHVSNIAYGYKELYKSIKVGGFGNSGPCNINVICPLGNGWEPERNAVSLILDANGQYWCSGSLIRNTCNTNRPFVLTADHCFNPPGFPQQDVAGWRFTFQAWSATCKPIANVDGVTYNGSTLRANWGSSDFCLVELTNIPPANSGINYAGWTRSATPAQNATGLHHPSGDLMKISRAANPVTLGTFENLPANYHWQANWTQGVTEGGSSGSPLFDQNHRIIGQLSGGPSFCGSSELWDFYGRFNLSWTGGGTNATRLSNWLDPSNSGASTTNTANIATQLGSISRIPTTGLQGDNSFCTTSNNYTIQNLPSNATVAWNTVPASGTVRINSPNAQQTTLSIIYSGVITLNATITNCEGSVTVSKQVIVGNAPPSISASVSGCNGSFQVWNLVNNNPGYGTNWNWTVDYLSTPSSQINIYTPNLPSTYASVIGGGTVRLYYTGLCGAMQTDGITIYNSGCYGYRVSVSPNPAKSNLNISIAPKNNDNTNFNPSENITPIQTVKSKGITIMSLFDAGTSRLVKQWKQNETINKNYELNINGLRKGVYVLQVDRDNQTTVTKVIIQ